MAGIAGIGSQNMVNRLGSGSDTASYGVASGAIFWRVLENGVHVTLFAP